MGGGEAAGSRALRPGAVFAVRAAGASRRATQRQKAPGSRWYSDRAVLQAVGRMQRAEVGGGRACWVLGAQEGGRLGAALGLAAVRGCSGREADGARWSMSLGDAGGAGVRRGFVVVQICRQDSRQEALLWCGSAVVMRRGRKQS